MLSDYNATTGLDYYGRLAPEQPYLPYGDEPYGGGGPSILVEEPVLYTDSPIRVLEPVTIPNATSVMTLATEPIRQASSPCVGDLCQTFSTDTAIKAAANDALVLATTVPVPPTTPAPAKSFPWLLLLVGGAGLYLATRKSTSLNGPDDAGLGRAPRRRSAPRAPQRKAPAKAPAKKATSRASLTI